MGTERYLAQTGLRAFGARGSLLTGRGAQGAGELRARFKLPTAQPQLSETLRGLARVNAVAICYRCGVVAPDPGTACDKD